MYQNVTKSDFTQAFHLADRGSEFTYSALSALYDHLTEMESDTGEQIELDVIALCCEWDEYDTAIEAAAAYSTPDRFEDESEALEWLKEQTTVVEFPGGVLIQEF